MGNEQHLQYPRRVLEELDNLELDNKLLLYTDKTLNYPGRIVQFKIEFFKTFAYT